MNFACNLASIAIISNGIHTEDFACWLVYTGWLQFIVALDFGISNSAQTELSFCFSRRDDKDYASVYFGSKKILIHLGVALGAASGVLLPAIYSSITKQVVIGDFLAGFTLTLFSTIALLLAATSQRALLARLLFQENNIVSVINAITQIIWYAWCSTQSLGLLAFCAGPLVGATAAHSVADMRIASILGGGTRQHKTSQVLDRLRRSAVGFAIPQIFAQAFNFIPVVIIGAVSGASLAGAVGGLTRVAGHLVQIAAIISTPLRPIYSNILVSGKRSQFKKIYTDSIYLVIFVYACLLSPLLLAGRELLALVIGDSPSPLTGSDITWFTILVFAQALGQPIAAFLNGIDRLKGQAIYGTVTVVTSLCLIGPFSVYWDVSGALAALALPLVFINLPCALIESRNTLKKDDM